MTARLEWLQEDGRAALFTLTEPDLEEDDEYEYYQAGSLLLGGEGGRRFSGERRDKKNIHLK